MVTENTKLILLPTKKLYELKQTKMLKNGLQMV